MSQAAPVVRCSVDRPELRFLRLPLPPGRDERLLTWGLRVLTLLHEHAPGWALAGSIVVFCPTARYARKAAKLFRLEHLGAHRRCFLYLGVQKMTAAERADNLAGLASHPGSVLLTNESWSHGDGVPGITMVVHLALAKGGIEYYQRSGRGAREAFEFALVVCVVSARLVVQRLQLCKPDTSLVGLRLLLGQLSTEGCLRAEFLSYLGQSQCPKPCAGCDHPRCSAADGRKCDMGDMPDYRRWEPASHAAVALFDAWPLHRKPTLTQLIRTPTTDAPAPFHRIEAHDLLVFGLLANKTITFEAKPMGEA